MVGPNNDVSPSAAGLDYDRSPSKRKSISAIKRERFLDHLGESSNVSKSARKAGLDVSRIYRLRREDPEFERRWLSALWEGYTHLEMEVVRRLREGDLQSEDGTKYDFANAIRLLSAHRDNAAKAQADQRNVTASEVRASIDRKVEAIRQQVHLEKLQKGQSAKGPIA